MLNLRRILTICFISALPAGNTLAAQYVAPLDVSRWQVHASPMQCKMEHEIPGFGRAIFERPSGGELSLILQSWHRPLKKGIAQVWLEQPVWNPGDGMRPVVLSQVKVGNQTGAIRVNAKLANRLLDELRRGREPNFGRAAWYNSGDEVRVGLSSGNFTNGYADWTQCMAQLLPVNFQQIERSVLLYGSDGWRLNARNRERLGVLVRFVKANPEVARIYVDGHSDSLGRRLHNRELSKQRANVVSAYLVEQGLDEEIITTRYHGERFPVANNRSKRGRDRNRRTTVRLELVDPAAQMAARSFDEADSDASRFTGPAKDPRK